MHQTRQILLTLLGGLLIVAGVFLFVLPGPGILLVLAGLTILSSQYDWARRLNNDLKAKWRQFWNRS